MLAACLMELFLPDGESVGQKTAAYILAATLLKFDRYVNETRAIVKTQEQTNKLLQALLKRKVM